MRRFVLLTVLAVLALGAGAAAPAAAATSPNCRAGSTLAVIDGKPACLRARQRCLTRNDRQYKTYGYRCRKPKRGNRKRSKLTLGRAADRRYGDAVALRPDGTIDKATALQAFAQTIGPLPGVRVARGAVGKITSGTGPWRWVNAYYPSLDARQRAAVDSYRRDLFPEVGAASADAATAQEYLNEAVGRIQSHVGESLGIPSPLTFGKAPPGESDALAVADTVTEDGKKVCKVTLTPLGQKQEGEALRSTLAHEAFHCFQDKWNPGGYGKDTLWLWEGSANWASALLDAERGHRDADNFNWWVTWLQHPEAPLFSRSYGAMGFFAHMEASGLGFWANVKPMIQAGSKGAYAIATGDAVTGVRLLDTWGPSYHRVTFPGPGWDFTGPNVPPHAYRAPLGKSSLADGGNVTVTSVERAAAIRHISLKAEVTTVSGAARGRLTDLDGNQRPLAANTYCTKPGGCVCPGGKPGPPDALNAAILVGVTGHDSVATVRFKGQKLSDWCKKAPPGGSLAISGAIGGRATGVGDCRVGSDGEFMAIITTDAEPRYYLQMDTSHYAGPGGYEATGRGVTSGPRVWVTDGSGRQWGTDDRPEETEGGGFAVTSETPTTISGTVGANMFSKAEGTWAVASGSWTCNRI